jgi:hypothetical protein
VRFDEGAYGRTVEARVADREWRRGSLVALVKGSELWGVAFEDGDWAEDARFVHADINLEEHKDAKDAMKFEESRKRDETRGRELGDGKRMPGRRAARRSRRPATWLGTRGRIRGRGRTSARRVARRSRGSTLWMCTYGHI